MADPTSVPVDGATPLRVTSRSGSVVITGEDRTDVLVERGADQVETGAEGVHVKGRSGTLVARCPAGTDVFVGVASGSVSIHGTLGDTRVTTQSGSITIDRARRVDARTGSGSIVVDECDGECRCQSGSGRLRVGRAGSVELVAASGSVEVGAVGPARVRAGSGSVTIGLVEPATVEVEAHSGTVAVSVPHGLRPAVALRASSGSVRCDCEPGQDGAIRVTTGSGKISVTER
jgi:DUF4097 and DUF4098 domain-containing protein YvlB